MLKKDLLSLLMDYPDDANICIKLSETKIVPLSKILENQGIYDFETNSFYKIKGGHDLIVFVPQEKDM